MVCGEPRRRIRFAAFPAVVRSPLIHVVWVLLVEVILEDFGLIEIELFIGLIMKVMVRHLTTDV